MSVPLVFRLASMYMYLLSRGPVPEVQRKRRVQSEQVKVGALAQGMDGWILFKEPGPWVKQTV